ncbi:hypothetical protein DPMN_022599 [Dreissena polymorpha]|uniref:Uncharacterized protein n=1 Tax=Dreissena polymorpha TaxID=45954 RepID=A0A9D4NMS5_DREPO|nr:hypothetical protein DPMN_022599 [Dreissena polymorpha]
MKKEQDAMRKDMKDLMTSMTATNKQLSEVPSFNLKLISVQDILDDFDSHVKDFAAEVGRRTHLFTRGLEKEKAATKSRLKYVQKI